ncbi:fungal-specific transcription factor domain-containing protein [Podospora fimiseda]|uniref:Fungal-specific transcription factor domain-containing protein n=1 Tax=Podospora fimiseda TaxID=252190 RepID=A0AAN7BKQ8_9PEZI|nr:fungal-specific transcription factor domain-containing protein [Podospora fimiseda]
MTCLIDFGEDMKCDLDGTGEVRDLRLWFFKTIASSGDSKTAKIMMTSPESGSEIRRALVSIAQAPPGGVPAQSHAPRATMTYSCQTCAKRKVKCDKISPRCSTCRKGGFDCLYQAPQPRRRKGKFSVDISLLEKLNQYETILREHNLLPETGHPPPTVTKKPGSLPISEPVSSHWNVAHEPNPEGKLFVGKDGQPRYTDSLLWRKLRDQFGDGLHLTSDDDEDDDAQDGDGDDSELMPDLLPGAFLAVASPICKLTRYHPSHTDAMLLWTIYRENVEPITRIVHVPSTASMVEAVSRQPEISSKAQDCLLFAIYHFAVYSITDEECREKFGAQHSRESLLRRYHHATQQALVNASFLKTTDMTVLQALLLYLLSSVHIYDSHTFWILSGVALRIGQRIGLHRDGEKLGLPPFEVQMRRRIFCQLLPLDGVASHMSGITGVSSIPEGWDTLKPLNINDDQIWPGMTEPPTEQNGATDLIFFLSRLTNAKLITTASKVKDDKTGEELVNQAKAEVEENFIRYCDVLNPLHFITATMARVGVTVMQIRIKLRKIRNHTATSEERRELFHLSMKVLETDIATHSQSAFLKQYQWHVQPFFLWGSWDSLIIVLSALYKNHSGHLQNLLSPAETDDAWKKLEKIYHDHWKELIESKRAVHASFGYLTLRAWDVRQPFLNGIPEPSFITALRGRSIRRQGQTAASSTSSAPSTEFNPHLPVSAETASLQFQTQPKLPTEMELNWTAEEFNFEANAADFDWMFWDQLVAGGGDASSYK